MTDIDTAYHEIINRIDAIEKRLSVKRKRFHKNPTFAFNCPTEAYNQLCEEAGALALTRSELLRRIVLDYLSNKGKPQGFAKRIIDDDDLIDL